MLVNSLLLAPGASGTRGNTGTLDCGGERSLGSAGSSQSSHSRPLRPERFPPGLDEEHRSRGGSTRVDSNERAYRCGSSITLGRLGKRCRARAVLRRLHTGPDRLPKRRGGPVSDPELLRTVADAVRACNESIDDATPIEIQSRLVEDLGLDSLDLVAVLMRLQDEHGIELDLDVVPEFRVVSDLMDELRRRLRSRPAA
ncbi:acyl carrier protein [Tautonia sociabilis]|uniref:Acyl carrier protein n=1 Tax=Tautonia sociabilis TaxID=2080755 RepID=A0A432MJ21_9BACT|nr:acyl carrier protein [Tautonia sociabilis]